MKILPTSQVPGLQHVSGFLSIEDQQKVQALLELEGYFEVGNQVMLFGADHIPSWCHQLAIAMPTHHFPEPVRCQVFAEMTATWS